MEQQRWDTPAGAADWLSRAVRAPYLLAPYRPERGDGISVNLELDSSTVHLVVHGSWGVPLRLAAHVAIRKSLSEHPDTLLIDLLDLRDVHATSASLWLTARRSGAAMDPPVEVAVCAPADAAVAGLLRRLGAARFLPLFETVAQAQAAIAERRPLTERIELCLPAEPHSAARIRAVVAEVCAAWDLADLVDRAKLVASEIVANAVRHAQPPITAIISRRGSGIHVAVRDADAHFPHRPRVHLVRSAIPPPSGLGLSLVHAATPLWGAMPTPGGKVVWATVRR
ncbi:ATP-binding protein [Actinoplanes sp. NPDC051859]|uniref:ATP-binding protein n=1 Tax=Actinoplanes sp. NPDC051859 TaxID=3363909 RepID=UPI0037AB5034